MDEFIKISQNIGKNSVYVQGAGGNTSIKIHETLLIKASGEQLKDMGLQQGYVQCRYLPLVAFLKNRRTYTEKAEKQFLRLVEEQIIKTKSYGKPSMETGFHASIPSPYIFHVHSVYINIFLCMKEGKKLLEAIFSEEKFLFIPYCNPGYALAVALAKQKTYPMIIFLQNHGVIVHGNQIDTCMTLLKRIHVKIESYLKTHIQFTPFRIQKKIYTEKKFLFPDAAIFMSGDREELPIKKRHELYAVFSAHAYIMDTIQKLGKTPVFLPDQVVTTLLNMKQEKYRQTVLRKNI